LSEEISVVSGRLSDDGVYVIGPEAKGQLKERGYGDMKGKRLYLKDYEALFLIYADKLKVKRGKSQIQLKDMVEFVLKRDRDAWTKFLIYRDLRSRGYVAKEGFGFGVDFRVYSRGEFGAKPAKSVVFGLDQGREIPVKDMSVSVDQIARMGKDPIVAVIESRGEVIYYKVSRARLENL
jgi:tRNA-intron endonuclease